MYIEIKENELLSWCEKPYLDYEYVDIDYATFDPKKYEVQNGKLIDISSTDACKAKIRASEIEAKTVEIKAQIEEIDKKRIRAIAEPSLKDDASGQTWLEYYTAQISALRAEITNL